MMNIKYLALAAALVLAACVEPTSEIQPPAEAVNETPVKIVKQNVGGAEATRIVIYRTSIMGLAIQPKVFVDERKIAGCVPGRSFSVEVSPGQHQISATTLSKKGITVSVAAGTTTYVRCSIGFGLVAGAAKFTEVPASEAVAKTAKLRSLGKF